LEGSNERGTEKWNLTGRLKSEILYTLVP
jgi:hypothetical protein